MIAGVILFSVANGSLMAIIVMMEDSSGYKDKVEVLIDTFKKFSFETTFFI